MQLIEIRTENYKLKDENKKNAVKLKELSERETKLDKELNKQMKMKKWVSLPVWFIIWNIFILHIWLHQSNQNLVFRMYLFILYILGSNGGVLSFWLSSFLKLIMRESFFLSSLQVILILEWVGN